MLALIIPHLWVVEVKCRHSFK